MAKKSPKKAPTNPAPAGKPSSLVDTRVIYCGDNIDQLKKLPGECVDLIYIDPPFNSNRNYEVFWGETKEKRRFEDRHASTQAYIEFMRPRCVELHRVLKKTGSFYYHCDWHASHYVKVMLDQILGENQFQAEIIWKRTSAHSDSSTCGRAHDTIFLFGKSQEITWNSQYQAYDDEYVNTHYRYKDKKGRVYRTDNLTAMGLSGGGYTYEWNGVNKLWRVPQQKMQELHDQGRIHYTKTGTAEYIRYFDEMPGMPLQDVWTDIPPVNSQAAERLGYPTQKPIALLDRIVKASSNPNDIVLDAFCGCGTALVAAENLRRQWIGIDISPTACRVMAKRLRDVCHLKEDEILWKSGRGFVVRDLPWTEAKLRELPPFEFENWAVIALGGHPNKAKVGDMGMDGRIYPVSSIPEVFGSKKGKSKGMEFMDVWYPVQVKQKDKVGRPDIDSFEAAMTRNDRTKGFFVSFDYSSDALTEIDAFFRKSHRVIIALTVKDILDDNIARKLA
jgi:DNA modification methylase